MQRDYTSNYQGKPFANLTIKHGSVTDVYNPDSVNETFIDLESSTVGITADWNDSTLYSRIVDVLSNGDIPFVKFNDGPYAGIVFSFEGLNSSLLKLIAVSGEYSRKHVFLTAGGNFLNEETLSQYDLGLSQSGDVNKFLNQRGNFVELANTTYIDGTITQSGSSYSVTCSTTFAEVATMIDPSVGKYPVCRFTLGTQTYYFTFHLGVPSGSNQRYTFGSTDVIKLAGDQYAKTFMTCVYVGNDDVWHFEEAQGYDKEYWVSRLSYKENVSNKVHNVYNYKNSSSDYPTCKAIWDLTMRDNRGKFTHAGNYTILDVGAITTNGLTYYPKSIIRLTLDSASGDVVIPQSAELEISKNSSGDISLRCTWFDRGQGDSTDWPNFKTEGLLNAYIVLTGETTYHLILTLSRPISEHSQSILIETNDYRWSFLLNTIAGTGEPTDYLAMTSFRKHGIVTIDDDSSDIGGDVPIFVKNSNDETRVIPSGNGVLSDYPSIVDTLPESLEALPNVKTLSKMYPFKIRNGNSSDLNNSYNFLKIATLPYDYYKDGGSSGVYTHNSVLHLRCVYRAFGNNNISFEVIITNNSYGTKTFVSVDSIDDTSTPDVKSVHVLDFSNSLQLYVEFRSGRGLSGLIQDQNFFIEVLENIDFRKSTARNDTFVNAWTVEGTNFNGVISPTSALPTGTYTDNEYLLKDCYKLPIASLPTASSITNDDTTHVPTGDAVYDFVSDALTGKATKFTLPKSGSASRYTKLGTLAADTSGSERLLTFICSCADGIGGSIADTYLVEYNNRWNAKSVVQTLLSPKENTSSNWCKFGYIPNNDGSIDVVVYLPAYSTGGDIVFIKRDTTTFTWSYTGQVDGTNFVQGARHEVVHVANGAVGSSSQPVYVDADGQVQPCNLSLLKAALANA